jgi:hypothetical protein
LFVYKNWFQQNPHIKKIFWTKKLTAEYNHNLFHQKQIT